MDQRNMAEEWQSCVNGEILRKNHERRSFDLVTWYGNEEEKHRMEEQSRKLRSHNWRTLRQSEDG